MHCDDTLVVLCTVPDAALGESIAATLVGEGLAACVSRVPGLVSVYRWQGEICCDAEELLLIKTTAPRFDALAARIGELHRHQTPEILALPVVAGDARYLDWLHAASAP